MIREKNLKEEHFWDVPLLQRSVLVEVSKREVQLAVP